LGFADERKRLSRLRLRQRSSQETVNQCLRACAAARVFPVPRCSLQQIAGNMSLTTMFWEEVADKGYDIMPNTVIDVRCDRWERSGHAACGRVTWAGCVGCAHAPRERGRLPAAARVATDS